jgi:hypothetical protein
MIGPERRRWVRNIKLFLISGFRYSFKAMKTQDVFKLAFDLLADCIQLRKLYIGVSDQTTDGLPAKKEQNLFAVKEWGCFDSVRGLGEIDLKVREVSEWDGDLSEGAVNIFEVDVKETWKWRRGLMFFKHKQVLEFERALSEDFRRPKGVQDEDIDGNEIDEEVGNFDQVKWKAGPAGPERRSKRKRTATVLNAPKKRSRGA